MLNAQEIVWIFYMALLFFFTAILIWRCRDKLHLIPFVIFGIIIIISLFYQLNVDDSLNQVYTAPISTHLQQHYWSSKSLVFHTLPIISTLLFSGIVEAQLTYVRHLTAATNITNVRRLKIYWVLLMSFIAYILFASISFLIQFVIESSRQQRIYASVFVTMMFLSSTFNTATMLFYLYSIHHSNHSYIRQKASDLFYLRTVPALLSIFTGGLVILNWLYCFASYRLPTLIWIVLETIFVYLPIVLLMATCIHCSKLRKRLGRQYSVQEQKKRYSINQPVPATMNNTAATTFEIAQASRTTVPPATYQPINKSFII
ncbi:hypothetical protein BDF20DRAFT_914250 [Mycotypha africana]|uniref:uncharacterized protein n=1 Tax=Mycotypha africana TaxID=64632 RepID=UPI0022FFF351|nr:uncharacterized protein BDF20DRAFT_914250 [Mycotypha africana]KAI8975300.1 hypothetical protein BDF20DRAFT_914250 [Mycotypha africana]